jgi:hypothetical protein
MILNLKMLMGLKNLGSKLADAKTHSGAMSIACEIIQIVQANDPLKELTRQENFEILQSNGQVIGFNPKIKTEQTVTFMPLKNKRGVYLNENIPSAIQRMMKFAKSHPDLQLGLLTNKTFMKQLSQYPLADWQEKGISWIRGVIDAPELNLVSLEDLSEKNWRKYHFASRYITDGSVDYSLSPRFRSTIGAIVFGARI